MYQSGNGGSGGNGNHGRGGAPNKGTSGQQSRGSPYSGGASKKSQKKSDKSHTLARQAPSGPYTLAVTAPTAAYNNGPVRMGDQVPQMPSLLGGNHDKQTSMETLANEVTQETGGQRRLVADSSQLRSSARVDHTSDTGKRTHYNQHFYTSLLEPSNDAVDMSKPENREMGGLFMPTLASLNHPTPLDQHNVQQRFVDSFNQQARDKGWNTTPETTNARMSFGTIQSAHQQMVEDSVVFNNVQQQTLSAQAGQMPPPLFHPRLPPSPYQQTIVAEARETQHQATPIHGFTFSTILPPPVNQHQPFPDMSQTK